MYDFLRLTCATMSGGRKIKGQVHMHCRILELLESLHAVHDVAVNPRFVCEFMKPGLCVLITVVTCANVSDVASGFL